MPDLLPNIGAVVIGRNEGERLKRCLASMRSVGSVVYVDSGSTDGSPQWAAASGVELIELDMRRRFTAGRARNAGFRRLRELIPDIAYVQFIDGDSELTEGWIPQAAQFLEEHPDVGAVSGVLRERHPDRSIYNWMCEREWNSPAGEARSFGGITLVRACAVHAVGGFREDLIAGEEPELALRLRSSGWRVWRLASGMAVHDAAMVHFSQWWRRAVRTGYAFAHGAYLHGTSPERHWIWESRRAWLWGVWLPLGCLMAGLIFPPWGWATWLIYPLQVLRQTWRNSGALSERATLALFQVIGRFPEAIGQLKFMFDRLLDHQSQLIEYK